MQGTRVSVQHVGAMIARTNKHLEFDIFDIIEWCAEAIKNIAHFESFVRFNKQTRPDLTILYVENKRALLPCNIQRLLTVVKGCCPISSTLYDNDGVYLNFRENGDFYIDIDYIGIDVDKDGYPTIDKSQLQACYYYCLKMLYMEDFINGKIPENRYLWFDEQYGKYVQKSKSSFENTSRNDMNEVAMIMYNMIPRLRLPNNMG